ncbi:MAG: hypothetical protein CL555_05825 [Algoriphagus sp.]|nr:hypothetical protein [Algoriphagus sp.]QDP64457.1 MAG: putative tip attachment protein J [Prokaryotic dsDNA virus sp.]|tara:strand:+ start:14499 stop:16481 length:1983 start_codon:yes stop_codon:yes gene_type:complete
MGKVVKAVATIAAIAAAIPTGGTSLLALGLGVSSLAATAIAVGLSVGASLLNKPKSPKNSPEALDRLRANLDPRTPRKTAVGITALATDIRDEEFTDDQTYFHRFIVCASHKVESIDEIWFDDKRVWSSSGGVEGEAVGYLTVATRTEGSAGNAINISSRMGSTRRYTGLAYVHLRYKLTGNSKKAESPYAGGITTRITIRGKGAALPDPRDPAQDMDDQSTWAWDADACRNPALALLFYLLGYRINGLLAVGKGIPANRIDLDSFAVAANICDEEIGKVGGGTEPRYRCDGVWSEGDDPTTVMDMLKATMNADLDDVGGKLRLTVFHDDLADVAADFDDGDIIDGFDWQAVPPLDQSFNVVQGSYTDPSNESLYQQVDYPLQEMSSPDGIDRISTFNLPMVQSAGQAQRLAAMRLERQKYGGTFKAEFQATAWKVQKNSVIKLSFAQTGFVEKLFRVAEMEIRQDGVVPMTLVEENAAIYTPPTLAAAIAPVASTPYDRSKDPLVQALDDVDAQAARLKLSSSYTAGLAGNITQAHDGASTGTVTVTIPDHTRVYGDSSQASITGGDFTLDEETTYLLSYDDPDFDDGELGVDFTLVEIIPGVGGQTAADAYFSAAHPYRHYLATVTTVNEAGEGGGTGGASPPGGGGWDGDDPGGNIP